jgi:AcrR family transcriptional regulator
MAGSFQFIGAELKDGRRRRYISTVMNKRGRGRPSGPSTTRADIAAVARRRFLAEGYDRVSLRSIAEEAGVDVALISYHFGSKKGLFGAALALAANPAELFARQLDGPLNSLPDRMLRAVLQVWSDPETGASLRALLEAAVRDPDVTRLLRELLGREILTPLAARIGGADATRRAAVAASQVAGLIMARYVLQLEPLASMPPDEVVARLAPTLRATLARRPAQIERW